MHHHRTRFRSGLRAFTLIELMVAVSILVLVILSIGVVFQSVSRSVGMSQSSMEMLGGVRSAQQQLERDIAGIDKNAFLVIRCRLDPTAGSKQRFDQISFVSLGSFPHRTGTNGATPFADGSNANAAFVWWGQLAMESSGSTWTNADRLKPGVDLPSSSTEMGTDVPIDQVPTGANENQFTLGRSAILLAPATSPTTMTLDGNMVAAFQPATSTTISTSAVAAAAWGVTPVVANTKIDVSATAAISQSRVDVAANTPNQVMAYIQNAVTATRSAATSRYEANNYCYRFASPRSPYDDAISPVIGYFRMHPVMLQGVSSLAIDWTDGSVYAAGDIDVTTGTAVSSANVGTTRWYGMYDTANGLASSGTYADHFVDHGSGSALNAVDAMANGDDYTAIFSFDNRPRWPTALRFRYHVTDPTGRLPAGRDFVQVVKLP